jgi:hypothetical protein
LNLHSLSLRSNLAIGQPGTFTVHRRKLVPTLFEKLLWGPDNGCRFRVADTLHGHINPLARFVLIALRELIQIPSWPAIWLTRVILLDIMVTVVLSTFTIIKPESFHILRNHKLIGSSSTAIPASCGY